MVRSGDSEKREIWGTREELLLAFAVTRHGSGSRRWDSVAMEIQSRTTASHLVTPQGCRQRFRDLQRRFDGKGGGDDGGEDGDVDPEAPPPVPWLEELRRLRVAELRREVDRYDLSIRSLQLKVKRLQEEIRSEDTNSGEGKPVQEPKKGECSPGSLAGDRISSGDGSGPSVEHSNSSDPKQKPGEPGPVLGEEAALPSNGREAADPSSGGEEKAGELSYNGSTGSLAARPQAMGESGESIAESKGGEAGEGDKEASDVQSSVSLSRRRRMPVAAGGGEEPEAEEVSKGTDAESRPLATVLGMIQLDKYGSVFERRLESQEGENYRSLVRQHMDLEMVRSKLDRAASGRSYSNLEFFRDLLLLCTNAAVFYDKDSPEFVAAAHLRRLVSKEMAVTLRTPEETTASAMPPAPSQPKPTAPKPKPEPDLAGALADKPIPSVPLILCRKRSSIANKSAAPAVKEEEEKPEPVRKESDDNEEEKILTEKATKERSALSGPTRGLRTNKVRNPAAKRLGLALPLKTKPAENVAATEEAGKQDKKSSGGVASSSTGTGSTAKKQSATGFLNRMKRSTNGTLMEMLKSSSSTGGGSSASGKGTELRKEMRGEGRKEQSTRQGSGGGGSGKKAAEASSGSAKRSVGRPPKRGAATPSPVPAKRTREVAEPAAPPKTTASTSRKRGRR